jgi:hypothetical protein
VRVKGVSELKDYKVFKDLIFSPRFKIIQKRFLKLRGSFHKIDAHINKVYEIPKILDLSDDKRIWEKENFTTKPQDSNPIEIL